VFLAGCALHLLGTLLHSLLEDEMVSSEAIARRILELMGCDLQESKGTPQRFLVYLECTLLHP
jgi:hypothetical protein